MNGHRPTPSNDPLAKFRDPPEEEGTGRDEELREDRSNFDFGLDLHNAKPMSLSEIEAELSADEPADWGPAPDSPEPYQDERATFYEQRSNEDRPEIVNPRAATPTGTRRCRGAPKAA